MFNEQLDGTQEIMIDDYSEYPTAKTRFKSSVNMFESVLTTENEVDKESQEK